MIAGAGAAAPVFRRRATGRTVALDPSLEIGAGGEARVFAVPGDAKLVAKLYHQPTPERARKVARMIAAPPRMRDARAALAWPVDVLHGAGGRFAGFVMPRAAGPRLFELYNPITRRRSGEACDPGILLRAGVRLAAAFDALHAAGYVVGDVNESNVLLGADGTVTLVDTDSFQVRDPETGAVHRSKVGKAEFTPPELQGKTFGDFDRTPEHDRFGLGVLLFLALMEGTHPFAGRMEVRAETPPVEERIRRGLFPHHGHPRIRPPRLAPPFAVLDPDLRALFVRCFVAGHADPSARPTAAEWGAALAAAEARLRRCGASRRHLFGRHLRACPWCERTRLLHGRDPFPADPRRAAAEIRDAPKPAASRAKPSRVPVPAVVPAAVPAVPAPPRSFDEWVGAAVRRPAAWIPPSAALIAYGPSGVNAAALGVFVVALALVCVGYPKRDPRTDGLSVVAVSWIATLAVWAFFLLAGGPGAARIVPVPAAPAAGAGASSSSPFRVRVAGQGPAGVDAPPVLLNAPEVERAMAATLAAGGRRPTKWAMQIGVRVMEDGRVDPASIPIRASGSDVLSAVAVAAVTARFRPLTSGGRPVKAEVWLHLSGAP